MGKLYMDQSPQNSNRFKLRIFVHQFACPPRPIAIFSLALRPFARRKFCCRPFGNTDFAPAFSERWSLAPHRMIFVYASPRTPQAVDMRGACVSVWLLSAAGLPIWPTSVGNTQVGSAGVATFRRLQPVLKPER